MVSHLKQIWYEKSDLIKCMCRRGGSSHLKELTTCILTYDKPGNPSSRNSKYLLRTTSWSCQTHHLPPYLDGSCKLLGSYPGSQCWRGHYGPQRGPWCSCPIPKCSAGRQGELGIKRRLALCDSSPNPNMALGNSSHKGDYVVWHPHPPQGPIPGKLPPTQTPPWWSASRASLLDLHSSPLPVCSISSWECFCYCPVYLPQQSHKSPCLLWTPLARTTGLPETDHGRGRCQKRWPFI